MTSRTLKNYTYTGLGFPIELENVEEIEFQGKYHPKLDIKAIALKEAHRIIDSIFTKGAHDLSFDEIKFLKKRIDTSLIVLDYSHEKI